MPYLVTPDDPLLLLLLVQPSRPLVLDILEFEAVLGRVLGQKVFDARTEVALEHPKFDLFGLGVPDRGDHHDFEQPFVEMARGQAENVEGLFFPFLLGHFGLFVVTAREGRTDRAPDSA